MTVFGKTKIMLNRVFATCDIAHWLCHWNLHFCLSPTSLATWCWGLSPHQHWYVLEYLTSMSLTPFTDMCGRGRERKTCGRGRQNVCVRTSLAPTADPRQHQMHQSQSYTASVASPNSDTQIFCRTRQWLPSIVTKQPGSPTHLPKTQKTNFALLDSRSVEIPALVESTVTSHQLWIRWSERTL